ncbi:mechanosensitive ion channel family protein [Ferrimonas balearica]|uniref:mechanosensitive ion channel family protein n=1 Tax=Ferrimonas balearica TaxID=44012 RepID=UPI001C99577D|nr:mechanosensitive ion channel family protein [Ferrimonas balearica]MBY5920619.1 mechanosensitive ion channel family protein [Ferrimonas balearica]MBY5996696.1 mechanosensitive ion channel family protein [Ferrimonas balearica]
MWRSVLFALSFFCVAATAEEAAPAAPPSYDFAAERAAVLADIESTSKRVDRIEANWKKTESEMGRDLLQQQVVADTLSMSRRVDAFLDEVNKANIPEVQKDGVAVLRAENEFLQSRLELAASDLRSLYELYEQAQPDKQLLVLLNINDFYSYMNWLLGERQQNLAMMAGWGVDIKAERRKLNREITRYAEFMASYLRASARQKELLKLELKTLPADARSAFESQVATQDRLVKSAVGNLKELLVLMEAQQLPVEQYNELIFKATGNLAEAVVSVGAMRTVLIGMWEDAGNWFKTNIGGILSRIVLFFALMGAAVLLGRLVRRGISRAVTHKKARFSALVQDFFITIGGNLVVVIGLLFALAQVGWDLTPVLTGLGVAGIVIGFALQDTLSNFASGMMILIYRPFDVGDYIEAGGVAGKVGKMSLVNTTIRTFDNQVFMVPNAKIWGETIKNITSERIRRVDMVFGVAYTDNVEQVEEILNEIVTHHPSVLKAPEHVIRLHVLNESSVDFIVRPWVKTDDYWDVYWDITREVKVRFDREGITIPFPQRELHVHTITPPPTLPEEPVSLQRSDTGLRAAGEGEDGLP